jgi:hypothetical protein
MKELFNTPILFIIFKRPETTQQVFEAIRKIKPSRLFVAANAPRAHVEGETERCSETRSIIEKVDWDCKVQTLFREEYLEVKLSISSAISWFFENVEEGIILEDDCLPSQSFFKFCEELLEKYRNDNRIWQIGGTNFQNGIKRGDASYYFSGINHVWGWASWANRWKFYDVELDNIPNDLFIKKYWSGNALKYWRDLFWKMKNKEIDTWDYQCNFTLWFNKGLTIIPNDNLISNIGFGIGATHTKNANNKDANKPKTEIDKIIHPKIIERFEKADYYTFKNHYSPPPLIIRAVRKIKRLF